MLIFNEAIDSGRRAEVQAMPPQFRREEQINMKIYPTHLVFPSSWWIISIIERAIWLSLFGYSGSPFPFRPSSCLGLICNRFWKMIFVHVWHVFFLPCVLAFRVSGCWKRRFSLSFPLSFFFLLLLLYSISIIRVKCIYIYITYIRA